MHYSITTPYFYCGMDSFLRNMTSISGSILRIIPVIIIGAGRVGREAAQSLEEMNVPYRVIEKDEFKAAKVKNSIVGDASDKVILERAGQ